jgi:glutamate synthase (NADPH/NADH) large chain
LLATAAVHNHLIRKGLRTSVGLVVESGEAARSASLSPAWPAMAPKRSTPIWPSTRCSTCTPRREFPPEVDRYEVVERYIKSIGKGILKVMSKMGISTYQSYCGAQIFDAVGLSSEAFVDKYFTGTATTIEGVGLAEVAAKPSSVTAWPSPTIRCSPPIAGSRAVSTCTAMRGEDHMWTPDAVATLQHAVRGNARKNTAEFAER